MQDKDRDLQETSMSLQGRIHAQKENGPKTEGKCSAKNLIRTCSEKHYFQAKRRAANSAKHASVRRR